MEKNTYIKNGFVSENMFRTAKVSADALPVFKEEKNNLPAPLWEGHEKELEMYWKAWEMGFGHLKLPLEENGFISSYLDTAYNGNIFMWDSVFITHFARYGTQVFPFQKTLDNFYRKQHLDGFICREIYGENGDDAFQRYDPVSTGPNVLAWAEWEHYKAYGDKERLNAVYPALCGYHLWLKENRTWKDGSYWTSGWGSGMDNIPRIQNGKHPNFSHGHMTWIDITLQQYMNAQILLKMGFELERWQEIEEVEEEIHSLKDFVRTQLWDDNEGFLFDLYADGSKAPCKHIGAFWALHTDILDENQIRLMVEKLQPGGCFYADRMVPSTDPSHPRFRDNGRYWQGGVWAPTNYMILGGLIQKGYGSLAFELAGKHHKHIFEVYKKTGTFWEYYSPTEDEPGFLARPDFVGWTGLVPVAVLFEFIMGIRSECDKNELYWNIRLQEEHGVERYPFGSDNTLSLKSERWTDESDSLTLEIDCEKELTVELSWKGGVTRKNLSKGKNKIKLSSGEMKKEKRVNKK